MKRFFIIALVAGTTTLSGVYAQNNVGINNNAPNAALDVTGNGSTNITTSLNVANSNGTSVLVVKDDVKVGINNSTPDASAVLDVQSTTGGILIPRLSTVQRTAITTPATGLLVYDNTDNKFYYYDGTAWVAIGTGTANTGGADPTLIYTVDGF